GGVLPLQLHEDARAIAWHDLAQLNQGGVSDGLEDVHDFGPLGGWMRRGGRRFRRTAAAYSEASFFPGCADFLTYRTIESVSFLNAARSIWLPLSTVLNMRVPAAQASASRISTSVAPLSLAASVWK